MARYIGIDFSGNALQWSPHCTRSNVWIALAQASSATFEVERLFRVQECPGAQGTKSPFLSLIEFLCESEFLAAGIDAPFSVPTTYMPVGGHPALLQRTIEMACGKRPFPKGADFIAALSPRLGADPLPSRGRKVYRETEKVWKGRGVNVRSTLWNGPRGGAPFTVACLSLLARTGLSLWPWAVPRPESGSLLVEAFPAGQLSAWGLPHDSYNGSGAGPQARRQRIIERMEIRSGLRFRRAGDAQLAVESADALDSIICAFAGKAVEEFRLHSEPSNVARSEGWIAVHR